MASQKQKPKSKDTQQLTQESQEDLVTNDKALLEDRLIAKYPLIIKNTLRKKKNIYARFAMMAQSSPQGYGIIVRHIYCKVKLMLSLLQNLGSILKEKKLTNQKKNPFEEAKPSELSEKNLEPDNPNANHELDFLFAKFILENRLPFSIAKPLNHLIHQINSSYLTGRISPVND